MLCIHITQILYGVKTMLDNLKIGLDIDGVLLNFLKSCETIVANILNITVSELNARQNNVWDLKKRWLLNDEQYDELYNQLDWGNYKATKDGFLLLNYCLGKFKWKNIYFVSNFKQEYFQLRANNLYKVYLNVLKNNNLSYSEEELQQFFHQQLISVDPINSKKDVLKKLNIKIFVDDRLKNIYEALFFSGTQVGIYLNEFNIFEEENKDYLNQLYMQYPDSFVEAKNIHEVINTIDKLALSEI